MTHEQPLTGKAGVVADKGTISSNLLREINNTAVESHTSNSQNNFNPRLSNKFRGCGFSP